MREWKVEYYDGTLPLSNESSEEKNYENVRLDGVVFVSVSQIRTVRLSGFDYYFIDFPEDENAVWHFGGWNNRTDGKGYRYSWAVEQPVEIEEFDATQITNEVVLEGVFVPRPDSITLNLENENDPPILPGE